MPPFHLNAAAAKRFRPARREIAALIGVMACLGLWGTSPAPAAEATYQPWNGGATAAPKTQELVDELRALVDSADRARAADPRFLADLREALRRYDYPWRRLLLSDDFRDGNFTADPAWSVAAGDFTVAWGGGLASTVRDTAAAAQQPATQQDDRKPRAGDLAAAIIGQILANQNRSSSSGSATNSPPQVVAGQPAEIFLAAPITNAFALTATVTSRPMEQRGGLDLAVYQDAGRQVGYRLSYVPGGGFTLYSQTARGASVIETGGATLDLADGRDHVVELLRAPDGTMTVRLDGETLFSTVDRSFRDVFAGFTLINRGGDYMLRAIRIDGTT